MTPVSAIILAKDEEATIPACVASLAGLDEVIVIDTGSGDGTIEVATRSGARVVSERWLGFGAQRQQALRHARNDWVLFLDADERLSPALLAAVRSLEPAADGYFLMRRNYFLGQPMRNGRWANDWQLRLFDRRKASCAPVAVHESVTVAGTTVRLDGGLIEHHTDPTISKYLGKLNRYTTLEADQKAADGRRFSALKMLFDPSAEFLRLYLFLGGWRDGLRGLALAGLSALYKLSVQGKLLERSRG
jgi:glycosyltransferase involved in cell wall biosynthesis